MESINNVKEEDIKSLICLIPEVISCKVTLGEGCNIEEIHVLCSTGKNIKQLVRDIQSAINAKFEIDIDYKVISVAQINTKDFKDNRIKISEIAVVNLGSKINAVVKLKNEDKFYEGNNIKIKSYSNRLKAVAEATIAAIEGLISAEDIFYLEAIERKSIANTDVFLALVGCAYNNSNNIFCGCCIIQNDENESIAKSVLDAINRKISALS